MELVNLSYTCTYEPSLLSAAADKLSFVPHSSQWRGSCHCEAARIPFNYKSFSKPLKQSRLSWLTYSTLALISPDCFPPRRTSCRSCLTPRNDEVLSLRSGSNSLQLCVVLKAAEAISIKQVTVSSICTDEPRLLSAAADKLSFVPHFSQWRGAVIAKGL